MQHAYAMLCHQIHAVPSFWIIFCHLEKVILQHQMESSAMSASKIDTLSVREHLDSNSSRQHSRDASLELRLHCSMCLSIYGFICNQHI